MIPPIFVVIILGMKIADGRKVLGEEMTFWLVINYRLWKILTDLMRGTALYEKKVPTFFESSRSSFTYSVPNLAQCGNLAIFLPLWFYEKSILADFRRLKTVTLTILEAFSFDFLVISHLKMSKISKNSKFRHAQMVKMAFLGFKMTITDSM